MTFEVGVKLQTGERFEIEANSDETVADLKNRIEELEHIPVDGQMLIYSGRKLIDEDELNKYRIQPGSCLILIIKPGFQRTAPKPSPPSPVQASLPVQAPEQRPPSPDFPPPPQMVAPPIIPTPPPTSFIQGWKYPFNSDFGKIISDNESDNLENGENKSVGDESRLHTINESVAGANSSVPSLEASVDLINLEETEAGSEVEEGEFTISNFETSSANNQSALTSAGDGHPIIFRYTGNRNEVQVIGGQKNRSDSSSDSDSNTSVGRVSPPDNISGLTSQGRQEGANLEAKSASSTVSSDEFEPYNNRSDQINDQSVTESEFNPIVNSTLTHDGDISRNSSEPNQMDNPLFNDSYQDLKRAENLLAFRYADQLKQLANMGFPNEEFNIDLLQKHGGEVFPVIEELLAYQ